LLNFAWPFLGLCWIIGCQRHCWPQFWLSNIMPTRCKASFSPSLFITSHWLSIASLPSLCPPDARICGIKGCHWNTIKGELIRIPHRQIWLLIWHLRDLGCFFRGIFLELVYCDLYHIPLAELAYLLIPRYNACITNAILNSLIRGKYSLFKSRKTNPILKGRQVSPAIFVCHISTVSL
jgi:hypothetical protein